MKCEKIMIFEEGKTSRQLVLQVRDEFWGIKLQFKAPSVCRAVDYWCVRGDPSHPCGV